MQSTFPRSSGKIAPSTSRFSPWYTRCLGSRGVPGCAAWGFAVQAGARKGDQTSASCGFGVRGSGSRSGVRFPGHCRVRAGGEVWGLMGFTLCDSEGFRGVPGCRCGVWTAAIIKSRVSLWGGATGLDFACLPGWNLVMKSGGKFSGRFGRRTWRRDMA